jgi:hypothetical protein
MARKNQQGYPTVMGDQRVAIWTHTGPASYTQATNGSPATGGDPVLPSELQGQGGLKTADILYAPLTSDDGQYEVVAIPVTGNVLGSGGITPSNSWILRWIVSKTGAEVAGTTNLSARTIKLMAFGPK